VRDIKYRKRNFKYWSFSANAEKGGNVTEISKVTFKEHLSGVWEQQRPTASHYTDLQNPVSAEGFQ